MEKRIELEKRGRNPSQVSDVGLLVLSLSSMVCVRWLAPCKSSASLYRYVQHVFCAFAIKASPAVPRVSENLHTCVPSLLLLKPVIYVFTLTSIDRISLISDVLRGFPPFNYSAGSVSHCRGEIKGQEL